MRQSKATMLAAKEKADAALNRTNKKIDELGQETNTLYEQLTTIHGQFDAIRNLPSEQRVKFEETKRIRSEWKDQVEKIQKDYNQAAAKAAGMGAAGAGLGVAVVTLGPAAAMGIATTFGVASTGTAISALSGAAATNAALAWLGGGALAAGGGGMAAGHAFLALAGPVGWTISGAALLFSGVMLWSNILKQERLEHIFTLISNRDTKSYDLAVVELNERIKRINEECGLLQQAISEIRTFGQDYAGMTEEQQYRLGSYVNLMEAATQLLVNPIMGLRPKFAETDYDVFLNDRKLPVNGTSTAVKDRNPIISLANLLYGIEMNEDDKKLFWKSLRKNKDFLTSIHRDKDTFTCEIVNLACDAAAWKSGKTRE